MRTPGQGEKMVLEQNFFVEMLLPGAIVRPLGKEERAAYREPYPTPESRKPTLQWPRELPIGGEPAANVEVVTRVGNWMRETELPMLHLWASPGALNPEPVAQALAAEIKNLQSAYVGSGIHYIQEDQPEMIGRTIADWRRRVYKQRH
jgi:haloalkane dehalogenase